MRINGELNPTALQHMAARALEARDSATSSSRAFPDIAAKNTPDDSETTGNVTDSTGKTLPDNHSAELTGLQNAIERLRENTQKSPGANGLQKALEMLQNKSTTSGAVDIQA